MQKKIYTDYLHLLAVRDVLDRRVIILAGLPGSGKSTFGEILRDNYGYAYLSSDVARVTLLKRTKAKYATTEQYLSNKAAVYDYLREQTLHLLHQRNVVLDATHLNEQLIITLDYLQRKGVAASQMLIVYVYAGPKEEIRQRFIKRQGVNADGRTWESAWETAYDYFTNEIRHRRIVIPENNMKGVPVVWVANR